MPRNLMHADEEEEARNRRLVNSYIRNDRRPPDFRSAKLWQILRWIFRCRWSGSNTGYTVEQSIQISRRVWDELPATLALTGRRLATGKPRTRFAKEWLRTYFFMQTDTTSGENRYFPTELARYCTICSRWRPIHFMSRMPNGPLSTICVECTAVPGAGFCQQCQRFCGHPRSPYHWADSTHVLCRQCSDSEHILEYRANPVTVLRGGDTSWLKPTTIYEGVELEVEVEPNSSVFEAARSLNGLFLHQAILKHDGSLREGFEICTLPLTLNEHAKMWDRVYASKDWDFLLADATPRAGLHIHASRAPLSALQIARMVHFFSNSEHRKAIEEIAGRSGNSYCVYQDIPVSAAGRKVRDLTNSNPARHHANKYEVVNLLHPESVEVRAFQSTKSYDRMMARLEFVQALLWFCKDHTSANLTWQRFAEWIDKPPVRKMFKNARRAIIHATDLLASKPQVIRFNAWANRVLAQLIAAANPDTEVYQRSVACVGGENALPCQTCTNTLLSVERRAGILRPNNLRTDLR